MTVGYSVLDNAGDAVSKGDVVSKAVLVPVVAQLSVLCRRRKREGRERVRERERV